MLEREGMLGDSDDNGFDIPDTRMSAAEAKASSQGLRFGSQTPELVYKSDSE